MPNFKQHLKTGAIAGLAVGAIRGILTEWESQQYDPGSSFKWSNVLKRSATGGAIGAIFGVLPDILEPAYHPHHRQIFHSYSLGLTLAIGLHHLNSSDRPIELKELSTYAFTGYLSHLVLDAQTPKGLPLI